MQQMQCREKCQIVQIQANFFSSSRPNMGEVQICWTSGPPSPYIRQLLPIEERKKAAPYLFCPVGSKFTIYKRVCRQKAHTGQHWPHRRYPPFMASAQIAGQWIPPTPIVDVTRKCDPRIQWLCPNPQFTKELGLSVFCKSDPHVIWKSFSSQILTWGHVYRSDP